MKKIVFFCILISLIRLDANAQNVINGHEYVDLGLPSGVKWATCNLGANSPSQNGNYYGWGELICRKSKNYCSEENSQTYDRTLSDISGNSTYDVARRTWGSTWRIPTEAEVKELKEKCMWFIYTQNGVNGIKIIGPNKNFIFLPFSRNFCTGPLYENLGDYGLYWTSSPIKCGFNASALQIGIFASRPYKSLIPVYRYFCLSIRPVSN